LKGEFLAIKTISLTIKSGNNRWLKCKYN
jgi:hypothetical protein